MKFFADSVLKPYLLESGYRDLCEIGASLGENTDRLLEVDAVRVTLIDPCFDARLPEKYAGEPRIRILRGLSLDELPKVTDTFDCILIDGDHNWYTVYHELKAIEERGLLRDGGTIFFHDVGWPYGRRDMYYDPAQVPAEWRQPHAKRGIVPGVSPLADIGGANGHLENAVHEGGPRNGVLTAVEDFWGEHRDAYAFFRFDREYGLGVMRRKGGSRASRKAFARFRRQARLLAFKEAVKDFLKPSRKRHRGA